MRRPPREELVARFAPGRSFLDVGAMWSVHGAIAFAARDAGATTVTALDVMGPTTEFLERQGDVRFVQGDVHDPGVVAPHDVVWCSGVLYHAPHPMLTLERLRALTNETLLLATETIGTRGRRAVFAPDPGSHPAHTEAFDPAKGYGNWWWGLSRSAVVAMVEAAGFGVTEQHVARHHLTVVARKSMNADRI
jgi:hypothetical protein